MKGAAALLVLGLGLLARPAGAGVNTSSLDRAWETSRKAERLTPLLEELGRMFSEGDLETRYAALIWIERHEEDFTLHQYEDVCRTYTIRSPEDKARARGMQQALALKRLAAAPRMARSKI